MADVGDFEHSFKNIARDHKFTASLQNLKLILKVSPNPDRKKDTNQA